MKKRNLYTEIAEGFDAMSNARGQAHAAHARGGAQARAGRDRRGIARLARAPLSRQVFARYLRTNPRTLENWEQGRAKPNAQAALLIRLVEKFPTRSSGWRQCDPPLIV